MVFKKGQSGNPAGRKRGSRNTATVALEDLLKGHGEALVQKAVDLALAGHPAMLKPVETSSLFAQVIQDHLDLKEKNSELESDLPIDKYKTQDPFENHPLFKTEEQAKIEETMDGEEQAVSASPPLAWPTETDEAEPKEEGLWSKSRDFDWGD